MTTGRLPREGPIASRELPAVRATRRLRL